MRFALCLPYRLAPTLALALLTAARAADYFVAPNGHDANPGTQTKPFATLQKGHDSAAPGDTVFIRGGTYELAGDRAAGVSLSKNGQPGKRIQFWSTKAWTLASLSPASPRIWDRPRRSRFCDE